MNLPMLAVILEEHSLGKISNASRVVKIINDLIKDDNLKINLDMTGIELSEIFKQLDYDTQMLIIDVPLFDAQETSMIGTQINLLDAADNDKYNLNKRLRELFVSFIFTIMTIIAVILMFLYDYNAKYRKLEVESTIISGFTSVLKSAINTEEPTSK